MNPTLTALPVLVLYPHRRCNCRCVMCDIWKDRSADEISPDDLERHLDDISRLKVQWIVLSGGEPLMHSDLFRLTALIRSRGIRVTILTTGLLLEHHARSIVESVDDVIVSLDGPPPIHDQVRRVPGAFTRIACGIAALHQLNPEFPVSARSTVQRLNYRYVRETARLVRQLGFRSISFLAADMTSQAFNRTTALNVLGQAKLALDEGQISELSVEFSGLWSDWAGTDFLVEDRPKLHRILQHFRAQLGVTEPVAPRCNAPWVSAVLESDGTVRPCFFQDPIGKAGESSLLEVVNGPQAVAFRSSLDVSTDSICKRCVCSLNWKECA
ncbi:MAG: radical SAM protein [Bryobacteraceae bacterium]